MSGFLGILTLVGLVGIGYWAMQNPGAIQGVLKDLKLPAGSSSGGGGGAGAGAPATTTAAGDCTSKTIYPATGKTWVPKYNGGESVSYSSGGSSTTYRWDADGVTSDSLEATYFVTWPSGSGKGDHLELKFWGPGHSGSACCWCMFNINGKGETGIGHEGPHPSTKNFSVKGKNVGNIVGKKVGIKGVIWPAAGGAHIEGWVAVSGTWEKVVEYDGPCGVGKKSTSPVASQQIQFRVDSIEPTVHCSSIAAITKPSASAASASSNYAMSYYAGRQMLYNPRLQEIDRLMPRRRINALEDPRFILS